MRVIRFTPLWLSGVIHKFTLLNTNKMHTPNLVARVTNCIYWWKLNKLTNELVKCWINVNCFTVNGLNLDLIKNPNWQDTKQLATYKRGWGVELGTIEKQIQLVARAGIELGTCALRVRRAGHAATRSPKLITICFCQTQLKYRNTSIKIPV